MSESDACGHWLCRKQGNPLTENPLLRANRVFVRVENLIC